MLTQKEYKDQWGVCPCCGGQDIFGRFVEIELREASQELFCGTCEAVWVDFYYLESYVCIKEGKGHEDHSD